MLPQYNYNKYISINGYKINVYTPNTQGKKGKITVQYELYNLCVKTYIHISWIQLKHMTKLSIVFADQTHNDLTQSQCSIMVYKIV